VKEEGHLVKRKGLSRVTASQARSIGELRDARCARGHNKGTNRRIRGRRGTPLELEKRLEIQSKIADSLEASSDGFCGGRTDQHRLGEKKTTQTLGVIN